MILFWRGWGLLAVVALFPLLASCGGLIYVQPMWVFWVEGSLCLLFAAAVCVYFGTRWNRNGVEHSLYFIPLQAWGWLYLAALGLWAAASIYGAIKHGWDDPDSLNRVIFGAVGLTVVVASAVALRWLTRLAAKASDTSSKVGVDRRQAPRGFKRRPDR